MSKVDAQRAMREAKYASEREAAARRGAPSRAAKVAAPAAPAPAPAPAAAPVGDGAELCGHRSMNNRICRRPAGHPEKNHRYT